MQQSYIGLCSDQYRFTFGPILVDIVTTIGSPSKRIVVYILHLYCLVYALLLVANLTA